MPTRNIRIHIGGNIGAGKSTQLKLLKLNYDVMEEPVDSFWCEPLKQMYSNPKMHLFNFQILVQIWYLHKVPEMIHDSSESIHIIERSSYDSLQVFAKTALQGNLINCNQFNVLHHLIAPLQQKPDLYIYLQTDPKICYKRIKERNRECEQNISIEYLKLIDFYYVHLLQHFIDNKVPVIIVKGDQSIDKIQEQIKNLINRM